MKFCQRSRRTRTGEGERTVSMEEVTMCVGSSVDHEKEVNGAE